MRTRLLSLIAFAAVALASCQKETQQKPVAITVNQLVGTWSIVKINSTTLDASGQQVSAITYQKPLNAANYIKFKTDSTAQWNADHFYVYGKNEPGVIVQNEFKESSFFYLVMGNNIILSRFMGPQGPMGPQAYTEEETAAMPSPNSLVIHSVYKIFADGSTVTADTYYTR